VAIPPRASAEESAAPKVRIAVRTLDAYYGAARTVRDVNLAFHDGEVTAIIGPSGCGKSTLLRCLNRMHETIPGARVEGEVLLDGEDIYARDASPIHVRRRIGMVFQRPTPFPTMSIRDNVAAGFKGLFKESFFKGSESLNAFKDSDPLKNDPLKTPSRREIDQIVERSLRDAALWDEVKDRLKDSAMGLSGGQQQRLCIARALATSPRVILLDEPTASLDPISTQKVEELVYQLRGTVTVVIVTHNMQQAARVSNRTAFMLGGELVEVAPTSTLFTNPKDPRTEAYITGRFG